MYGWVVQSEGAWAKTWDLLWHDKAALIRDLLVRKLRICVCRVDKDWKGTLKRPRQRRRRMRKSRINQTKAMWRVGKGKTWFDGSLWKCEYLIHPGYWIAAQSDRLCVLKELQNQRVLFKSNGQKFYIQK